MDFNNFGSSNEPDINNMPENSNNNKSSVLSIIALILSILSFTCCCSNPIFATPGLICAIISKSKSRQDKMALLAIVLSSISLIMFPIVMILLFMFEDTL